MIWRNTARRFGAVHQFLHWIIAVLVIGMICVGLYMTGLDPSPRMFNIYALHKSVGITVLALVVLRLIWRLSNIRPSPLPNHLPWEKFLAAMAHALLYAALLVMPLSGWVMSSAEGFSVSFFGLFTLPDLVNRNKGIEELAENVHEWTAWGLMGLIALHVAGALKHHIIDRDETLRRMVPGMALKKGEEGL